MGAVPIRIIITIQNDNGSYTGCNNDNGNCSKFLTDHLRFVWRFSSRTVLVER